MYFFSRLIYKYVSFSIKCNFLSAIFDYFLLKSKFGFRSYQIFNLSPINSFGSPKMKVY